MISTVTHCRSTNTNLHPQAVSVTAHVRSNPNLSAINIQFHTTGTDSRATNSPAPEQPSPMQALGMAEWNYLSRFLLPRDMHRLSQTCTRLHAVGQQLLRNVNEKSLARAVAGNRTGAAFVNAPPVACLRLSGNCGNAAAHFLSEAPNVNLLDLRGLQRSGAPEILRLARLHPNARVILNATQKTDLALELLAQSSAAIATATTLQDVADAGATELTYKDTCDPLQSVIDQVPVNLMPIITLEVAAQSTRQANDDSPDFNPAYEEWQTQRLALLASSLLARCQRDGFLNDSVRLYLAIEGIRRFVWNAPVHKHQHLLLLSKLALALEGPRLHDSITCHGILSALAVVLDTEYSISRRPNRGEPEKCKQHQEKVSPQQLLSTLMSWGLEPMRRNNWHENVLDKLEARGLRQPAHLLRQATVEALKKRSAEQVAAGLPDLSQCTVS